MVDARTSSLNQCRRFPLRPCHNLLQALLAFLPSAPGQARGTRCRRRFPCRESADPLRHQQSTTFRLLMKTMHARCAHAGSHPCDQLRPGGLWTLAPTGGAARNSATKATIISTPFTTITHKELCACPRSKDGRQGMPGALAGVDGDPWVGENDRMGLYAGRRLCSPPPDLPSALAWPAIRAAALRSLAASAPTNVEHSEGYIILWRPGVDGAAMLQQLCSLVADGSAATEATTTGAAPQASCSAEHFGVINGAAGVWRPLTC